jgi:hypothetical protein
LVTRLLLVVSVKWVQIVRLATIRPAVYIKRPATKRPAGNIGRPAVNKIPAANQKNYNFPFLFSVYRTATSRTLPGHGWWTWLVVYTSADV